MKGATITFEEVVTKNVIKTFTTRADTIFGVSYLAIAPEHPLVDKITTKDRQESVDAYRKKVSAKSDLERTELNKDKSGVFTGAYVEHPITKEKLPIWVADYVLISYGTGAVMGVPSGDERDFEFCEKFNLNIPAVLDPIDEELKEFLSKNESLEEAKSLILEGKRCYPGYGAKIINSSFQDLDLNGLEVNQAKNKAVNWLVEKSIAQKTITYKLRDWLFSRQRYWAEPFPILHLSDGTIRTLDIDELPLTPPDLTDFKPSGDGQSPLAKATDWINVKDPKTKMNAKRETNTMPQWAGSCWYYLRFCDPNNSNMAWDKAIENYWMPVDLYVGGVEHAVLHLLYARFWHKVLFDCSLVSTSEPFKTLRNQGLVTAKAYKLKTGGYVSFKDVEKRNGKIFCKETDKEVSEIVEKMSKSKLNGVSPDEIIEEVGADALRLYEMFMAPFDREKLWNYDAISGCKRFLNRFFDVVTSDKLSDEASEEALKLGHKLISGVEADIENMSFNTAIAKMMEFLNDFTSLSAYPKSIVLMAVKALYPFAPHFAEECFEILGGSNSLTYESFPSYDKKYLIEDSVTYVVQVNGKLRGSFDLPKDIAKESLLEKAKAFENVKKHIEGKQIIKEIFVPNKLVNIVVK